MVDDARTARLLAALERIHALLSRLPPMMRDHYLIRAVMDEITAAGRDVKQFGN